MLGSPLHGFSLDGYPIYGPYQADLTLAVSCWQVRVAQTLWRMASELMLSDVM